MSTMPEYPRYMLLFVGSQSPTMTGSPRIVQHIVQAMPEEPVCVWGHADPNADAHTVDGWREIPLASIRAATPEWDPLSNGSPSDFSPCIGPGFEIVSHFE